MVYMSVQCSKTHLQCQRAVVFSGKGYRLQYSLQGRQDPVLYDFISIHGCLHSVKERSASRSAVGHQCTRSSQMTLNKIFLNSAIFLLILAESNRKLEILESQQGDKETRISTHSSLGRCHMWSTRFVSLGSHLKIWHLKREGLGPIFYSVFRWF